MKEERGPWYLLTGLVIGAVLGLCFAWVISPVEYVDTSPASLRAEFKDQYRALIASAYVANGDLVRAKARLDLLHDEDIYRLLAEQAQRTLAENGSASEARALGLLALALGQIAPGQGIAITQLPTEPVTPSFQVTLTVPSPTPRIINTLPLIDTSTSTPETTETVAVSLITSSATMSVSSTDILIPRPTDTPVSSHTPTSTPGGPFLLLSSEKICTQKMDQPLVQIEAQNALGQPIPGVVVIITWQEGEERFYTGLKPEKGLGYADFVPQAGITYTIRIEETGEPFTDLTALECQSSLGDRFWGIWLLKFVQP